MELWRGRGTVRKFADIRGILALVVVGVMLFQAPGFAQGLEAIEPTLAECEAFVQENGVPSERPVAQNRGYSGYSVCMNMAYDGDLPGYFASADTDEDGVLQSPEQRAYLDSVIGSASDPDQSPLTVEKCRALVGEYGIPEQRPFADWGNRGYGDVEVCQAMAYDGDLTGSFATWDANGDGRLDRAETSAAVEGFGQLGGTPTPPARDTATTETTSENDDVPADVGAAAGSTPAPNGGSQGQAGGAGAAVGGSNSGEVAPSAAGDQYEATTGATGDESTGPAEAEATIPPYAEETTTPAAPVEAEQEPQGGIVALVGSLIGRTLPSTGGFALFGLLGGVVLIGGGFFAYRMFR